MIYWIYLETFELPGKLISIAVLATFMALYLYLWFIVHQVYKDIKQFPIQYENEDTESEEMKRLS